MMKDGLNGSDPDSIFSGFPRRLNSHAFSSSVVHHSIFEIPCSMLMRSVLSLTIALSASMHQFTDCTNCTALTYCSDESFCSSFFLTSWGSRPCCSLDIKLTLG